MIEKAFISFRIGTTQWMPENRYRELLALFERYKGVTDEITFFTSFTHPPLPVEEMRRRCEILAQRIPQAKALGYRAGINVLSTMGHHNENLPNSLAADFTRVTDVDGNVSMGSFCPDRPALPGVCATNLPARGRSQSRLHLGRRRRAAGRTHAGG